ncbi:MAG: bacteriohemerythrin [Sulfuricella sp.]
MTTTSKSEIFVWGTKYETGIPEVDQQHKKLVGFINSLARMQAEQVDSGELLKVFDELADYAIYHFKTEEDLMHRYQIDSNFEASHVKSHALFIQQALDARTAANKNPGEVTGKALTFLTRWLISHILGTDMRMAKEILALESGMPPAEARNHAVAFMADSNEILLKAMNEIYDSLAARTQDFWHANHRLQREIEIRKQTENELRKLSRAVEFSPVSIIITDAGGLIEYVNPKFTEVTGYRLPEVKGKTPRILKSGETRDDVYQQLWTTISRGQEWVGEFHNRKKNGGLFWEKASISPIADSNGLITHYLGMLEDITVEKQAEDKLQQYHVQLAESLAELKSQAKDLTLLNQMNELLQTCLTEEEAYRVFALKAAEMELGAGGALAIMSPKGHFLETVARWGKDVHILDVFDTDSCWAMRRGQRHEVPDPSRDMVCEHFQERPSTGYMGLPLIVRGEALGLLHIHAAPGCSPERKMRLTQLSVTVGEALTLALSNIRLREALREQATHDPLTGLFNRRFLDETLEREILRASREKKPIAAAMVDIDHFKKFNDAHGHEAGDRVLTEVAHCIRTSLRQSDIAYRYGGEEILIVMPASEAGEAAKRMSEIAARLQNLNIAWGEKVLPAITISAGIASMPQDGTSSEAILRAADRALYAAKQAGRNRVCIAE